jgi:hypothetical protein
LASSRNPFNRTRMSYFRLCFPAPLYLHAASSAMAHSFDIHIRGGPHLCQLSSQLNLRMCLIETGTHVDAVGKWSVCLFRLVIYYSYYCPAYPSRHIICSGYLTIPARCIAVLAFLFGLFLSGTATYLQACSMRGCSMYVCSKCRIAGTTQPFTALLVCW